jgi:hypothetical protein
VGGWATIINRAIEHCTLSTWWQAEFSRLLHADVTDLTHFTIYFRYLALAATFLYLMPDYFVFSSIWVQHGLGCFSISSFKYRKIMGSFRQQLRAFLLRNCSKLKHLQSNSVLSASEHKLASQIESICKLWNLTISNIFTKYSYKRRKFSKTQIHLVATQCLIKQKKLSAINFLLYDK